MKAGDSITPTVQIVRRIGEGAMSQIWCARHLTLHRDVAVKIPSERLASHPHALWRFAAEARAIARIGGSHVPQIFDCGTLPGGAPFIVMELVDGTSLEATLAERGQLTVAETSRLVAQLGEVLATAHVLGIVHRDVKPDNVVLTRGAGDAFAVKLLDFGLAKAPSDARPLRSTLSGVILGTPIYMSPEQFLSAKSVDARADMWSLAVVAYRCLTGALPFGGETFGAVFAAIERRRFPAASTLRRELPRSIDAWFDKAFARAPEDRFASTLEMAEAFEAATLPPSAWERATGSSSHWFEPPAVSFAPARARRGAALLGASVVIASLVASSLVSSSVARRAHAVAELGEPAATFEIERVLPPVMPHPFVTLRAAASVAARSRPHRALPSPARRAAIATPPVIARADSTVEDAYPTLAPDDGREPAPEEAR